MNSVDKSVKIELIGGPYDGLKVRAKGNRFPYVVTICGGEYPGHVQYVYDGSSKYVYKGKIKTAPV